jgi:hypothetical protein
MSPRSALECREPLAPLRFVVLTCQRSSIRRGQARAAEPSRLPGHGSLAPVDPHHLRPTRYFGTFATISANCGLVQCSAAKLENSTGKSARGQQRKTPGHSPGICCLNGGANDQAAARATELFFAVFRRFRHQPRNPPLAKIRPGSPAPAMGPGTAAGVKVSVAKKKETSSC